MKITRLCICALLLIIFAAFNCSNNPSDAESVQVTDNGQTLYLLGMDADPLGVESNPPGDFDMHFRSGFHGRHFGRNSEGRPAFCMDAVGRLTEALGLSEEQIAAIEPISAAYQASFDSLHTAWHDSASWQDIRERRQALRTAFFEEIKPILTDEQIALLEDLQAKFDRGQFPENMAERRLGWLTETLDLTGEQQEQVSALLVAAGDELLGLRDASESKEAFRAAAQPVLEALNEQIAALLDAAQLELYNEFPRHPRWRAGWHHR
jgi:pyrroloquinoline quinone (PQQ) biosynthesis protein C